MSIVFNYGGGRQTVAMCVLIAKGVLPKPDKIVMADTGRENQSTWEYLEKYTRPLLVDIGLDVEIASHDFATVKDVYALNGDLLLPAFTKDGKLSGFCSNEWKKRVCERYLRSIGFTEGGTKWLGFALDERKRWKDLYGKTEGKWTIDCPLVNLMLNTAACLQIIEDYGLPVPITSSCWMCPHKRNEQWRNLRNNYPEQWEKACTLDEEIRKDDEMGGVWLHHSRVPLREANIDTDESQNTIRQCSLGMCFV
jgi:hypothetical protein